MHPIFEQALLAVVYYLSLIVIMRLAGKRLAGQTTTFDLLILITLGVSIQSSVLKEGVPNTIVFVCTVFLIHKVLAILAAKFPRVRVLLRGAPEPLVKDGKILWQQLEKEGISEPELLAGLRKQGHLAIEKIKLAVLEETGHITAVTYDETKGSKDVEDFPR